MTGQFGAAKDAHGAVVTRSATWLHGASATDAALHGHLTQAAAVSRAGATRLDGILAQARAIANFAPAARTPAAQQAILAGLHTQMTAGQGVVNGAKQLVGGIAADIRALDYGFKQAPVPDQPPGAGDEKRKDKQRQNQIDAFRLWRGYCSRSRSDLD